MVPSGRHFLQKSGRPVYICTAKQRPSFDGYPKVTVTGVTKAAQPAESGAVMPACLFTIGHSSHPPDRFAALLQRHGVACLVDVRSQPASRHVPHFARRAMEGWLPAAGIAYRWMGAALGGRPRDPGLYGPDGRPDYARRAQQPDFTAAIRDLLNLAAVQPVAIMCAERDPLHCHRTLLVTPALLAQGAGVTHLMADGTTIGHAALQQQVRPQLDLFR